MNTDALRRRAMALGAKLEIDGRTFNAGRVQSILTAPPKPAAVQAAPPPPPPEPPAKADTSSSAIAQFAAATYLLQEAMAAQMSMMQKQIDVLTELAKPSKAPARKYTVKRDDAGDIQSIQVISE